MPTRADHLADIATAAISVARKIQGEPFKDPAIIPLVHLDRIVLRHIHRYPGIRLSDLAAELGLQPSNASTAIRSLTGKGMVRKDSDPADRRAVRLYATDAGEESTARVRHEWAELLEPLVESDADAARLAELLVSLDDALNRHVGSHGALGRDRTEDGS
ncbi:MarR family winged helix-turn-helix transcriptional regulator [Demequina sp. NBRC 110051]|uniref:MarR family winged helix-turn-helix transcriptional regulator n=1 Tax=Demequina sp. NBRC 110051 TaxID=1570340 RepID=UPI0013565C91|nr:MarR family transcriptional regulator [Demequina sp. NBRC 110051]